MSMVVPPTVASAAGPGKPPGCEVEHSYHRLKKTAEPFTQIGPAVRMKNNAPEENTLEASSEASGTVQVSYSVSFSANAGVVVAGVQGEITGTASYSLTVKVGMKATAKVPGRSTRYIKFGVTAAKTRGVYEIMQSNCKVKSDKAADATTPFSVGYVVDTSR
jgi:hypothetical protein